MKLLVLILLSYCITTSVSIYITDSLLKTLEEEISVQCLFEENIHLHNAVKSLEYCLNQTRLTMEKDKRNGRNKTQVFRVNICSKRFYENCLEPNEKILTKCLPSNSKTKMHFKHLMNGIESGLRYACADDGKKIKNLNFTDCSRNEYHVFKSCDKRSKVLKMIQNWTDFPFDDDNCHALMDFAKCSVAAYTSCPDKSISKFIVFFSLNALRNTPCKVIAAKLSQANPVTLPTLNLSTTFNLFSFVLLCFVSSISLMLL